MPEISRHYTVNIMTLTPVHIGTGRKLLYNYDYVVHKGSTWRVDEDALFDAATGDGEFDQALLSRPAGELLSPADFRTDSKLFRYVVSGAPRSTQTGAHVQEQIKDVFDRPYLPGSSLKGALRTALLGHALAQNPRVLNGAALERRRKFAARPLERTLLGRDPNHDLLRALHVADSRPLDPNSSLTIENVQVITGGKIGSPVEVEAIRPQIKLRTSLKLDLSLFTPSAERELRFGKQRRSLEQLMAVEREHAALILAAERDWYARYRGLQPLAGFYTQLLRLLTEMPENRCVLQIGWGGGWHNKTVGIRLQERQREDMIRQYKLARGKHHPGDPFPKSRRVALDSRGHPVAPLGWILLEMKPEVDA